MSERTRRIRHTPVQECVSLLPIDPLLVHPGDDPLEVMHRAAERPQTRLLGVVDDAGVLVGVLSTEGLAEAVVVRVSPETLIADIADIADAARFGHAVSASTVEDVMVTPATISETATIDEAFRRMHARRLSGLYVIDEAGRPTGYLDLLELTMRYVEALEDDRPPVDPRTEA
ncbi:MAG: CBS domain-containing protein [Chloroflexota bacterium]|nr:CBS domain-containing protein [Chloroflexota bacterium]